MGTCTSSNIATFKVVDNTSNESLTGISPADIFASEFVKNGSSSMPSLVGGSKTTNTKNKAPNIFDQSDRTACMSVSNRDDNDDLLHTTTINNTNENIYEYTGKGEIPKDLISIKLHRSLTSIPDNAFQECSNLQSIILNEGLVIIGNKAFANCTSLECIRIPSTVTSIGNGAFSHCTSLKEVIFKYSTKLHFGKRTYGSLMIGKRAFSGCTSLTSISIPPTLSVIDDELFTDCDSLKEIVFSEGVETVGRCSFGGCIALETISFPSSLTDIGEDAFRNCTMLKEVTFNEGLQKVGRCSFGGCKALEYIKLPQSIIKVGKWAFRDCTELTKVELGAQQRSIINQHTFAGCTKLDKSMIRTMMMVRMKGSLDLNTITSASLESVSLITYDEDDTTIDTKFTDETPVLERSSSKRKKKKRKSRKDGDTIDDSERSGQSKQRSRRRKQRSDKSSSRRRKHHRKSKSRSKIDKGERSSGKSKSSRSQVDAGVRSEISGVW